MRASTESAVTVRGLRKTYGDVTAVADVSFEVGHGEILGLLGPNGSGKTTTVECLQGLRRPDAGTLEVLGLDPRTDARRLRRVVGSQLQESALPDRLKVWEALRLFSVMSPQGPPWEQLLQEWGLRERRDASFGELSGGQRQRLFVALALVNEPELVILDEMTTGLDPAARRVAWDLVEAIRDRGTTVILVTHSMEEAARLCDRLVVMRAGRVVATGTPDELVEQVATGATVTFSVDPAVALGFLDAVEGVTEVVRDDAHVAVTGSGPLMALTAHALVDHGIVPYDLDVSSRTLEDAYLEVAAHAARNGRGGESCDGSRR